jgi:hypothetical protein
MPAANLRIRLLRLLAGAALFGLLAGCSALRLGRSGSAARATAVEPDTKPDTKKT